MKKIYSIIALAAMGVVANAQTTVNFVAANQGWTNAQALSGPYAMDANLDLTLAKGASTNAPAYYTTGAAMRIYTGGGYFTVTPKNGAVISAITVNCVASYAPSATYSINGGAEVSVTATSNTYTLNNLNASSGVTFKNVDSSTQLRVTSISVTYTAPSLATAEIKANNTPVLVKNTSAKSNITFGVKANDVKFYNMAGQVVKSASVRAEEVLNVEDLQAGMYIVTGTVNGQPVSQKILKK